MRFLFFIPAWAQESIICQFFWNFTLISMLYFLTYLQKYLQNRWKSLYFEKYITSNSLQIWHQKLWISVDEWTAELMIIASNVSFWCFTIQANWGCQRIGFCRFSFYQDAKCPVYNSGAKCCYCPSGWGTNCNCFHGSDIGSCFPSSATVSLENGKSVTMSQLQIGDQVQTGTDSQIYLIMYLIQHYYSVLNFR